MTAQRQTALITGASSGIGLEFARLFAADGHDVVLVARSEDRLRELAEEFEKKHGIRARVLARDLARRETPAEIFAALAGEGVDIDVLVNNAGFGYVGAFTETDADQERDMIEVNVTALTYLSKLFVQGMVARKRGFILNVASTAAFYPGPRQAVYYATKAYVVSFSLALAHELRHSGVRVMALCPGKTRTGFQQRAGVAHSQAAEKALISTAADVARYGYEAMRSNKVIVTHGAKNKLFVFASRFFPRAWAARAVDTFQSVVRGRRD